MPTHGEPDEWHGARRQPYHYSDGRYLTAREPRERGDRLAPRQSERRRRSLHRGYHSENETRQRDPWEADSEADLDIIPRGQHKMPRESARKRSESGARHVPPPLPANRLKPDDWDYDEDEWYTDYLNRQIQPRHRDYSSTYPDSRIPEILSDDEKGPASKPRGLGEHDLYNVQIPVRYDYARRSYPTYSSSDNEDTYNDTFESRTAQPGEHYLYRRGVPVRSKGCDRSNSEDGAYSDNDKYITKNSNRFHDPYRPNEHEGHHHYAEDRGFRPRTSAPQRRGEHRFHHEEAPPLPRLTRRAPTWKSYEENPDKPSSAPRSTYPGAEDGQIIRLPSYDGQPPTPIPPVFAFDLPTRDRLADPISRQQGRCARPTTSRSISDIFPKHSNTIIFPGDSRSEAGKSRTEPQCWDPTNSIGSSAHGHPTTASVSSASVVLGRKNYPYQGLEKEMDFRLVRVLPQRTSKLKCEILHASLEHPPEYIAVSYAWGDGVDTKRLILGGATISVAASLHGALRAIRHKDNEILVWVDGLSIDQQNKDEQAAQVQLMGYIYSRANYVAVWLGPDADDSQLAIPLLVEVDKRRVSKQRIRAVENPDSAALRSLFKRDYWSRLWVVQEVFLARKKWVYCGSSQLPWEAYETASDAFWEHESDPHLRQGPSSFPNVASLVGLGANSLLEVLRACRKKISENPRDKVFGVLGMLPADTRKELPVDYDQPVKALYIDVADHIISSTRRLDVIRESIHFPVHVSSAGLPSWCPEWSHIPDIPALRERTFSAAGETNADYEFHDNERKLEISAIELGTIEATGVAVGTLCALQDYLMAFLHWRALLLGVMNISEDDEDNELLEAFCRTLSLGQVPQQWEQRGWMTPCYHVFSSLIRKRLPRLSIDRQLQRFADMFVMHPEEQRMFVQKHFGDRMMGRTFCITENGLMGMGSGFMSKGDIVVIPFGCSTPILVRAEGRRNEFRYVGDVYIHGFMHGEALAGNRPVNKYMLH